MNVRDAAPRDLQSIRVFLQEYVDEFWNRPFPRPRFTPDYLTTGKVIVADDGGKVIGIAKGVLDRGCGHISFLYVQADKRGRGTGKALLRGLCAWFADQDVVAVTLGVDTSNPTGIRYWDRLGFHEFHRELTAPLGALRRQL
jgi:ribosomal protein S18 acetylase RimI-like enzyme